MSEILHRTPEELPAEHKNKHPGYEYHKREFVKRGYAEGCVASIYEIPPGKSAYPYHFHVKNEEVFYIISGKGRLKTPAGEKAVAAGDLLFFPANENGAHKLTNTSESELLVYLDFSTAHDVDVALYPDSGKIAVWGKGTNKVFKTDSSVDYYEGE